MISVKMGNFYINCIPMLNLSFLTLGISAKVCSLESTIKIALKNLSLIMPLFTKSD